VGYAAAAHTLDIVALSFFLFLFLWQLPHFIAIAMYRFEEYSAAGVPLVVQREPSPKARRIARVVFHYSLVVLTVWCVGIALYPYLS
jgi:protoheme IX farnesyltransferase